MFSNFWKKITIYNAALLIIFLRIYGPLINYIDNNSENNSIFAKYGESGYPFKESLKYNLDDIQQITSSLIKKYENNKPIIPMIDLTSNTCSLSNKLEICNDNRSCFEEINDIKEGNFSYHKKEEYNNTKVLNNDLIIDLIQEKNQFIYKDNNVLIEIPFYNQLIDGYSSYLNIFSDNINLIKQVTQNENKMNNLLFLYTLYLKCYTITDKIKNNIKINKLIEYQEENINNIISSLDKLKIEKLKSIINKIVRDNVINCIPDLDTRYSFLVDFQSINAMLQILLNIPKRENNKIFYFLFFKLTNIIGNIFALDEKIKERSQIFSLIQKYCFYVYWGISAIIIYFCNKYFIKHKEFYTSKNRTIKNINSNAEFKKYLKYQENIRKIQKKNRSKYTKEEIEMINKLTKDQKDYIITK